MAAKKTAENYSDVVADSIVEREDFDINNYTLSAAKIGRMRKEQRATPLTDEDIRISDRIINNTADVPETTLTTDVEEVDYISAQQKQISVKGNLQVKRELLSSKRAFTVKTFLNKFKHLFIKVISPSYTFVVEEPDGE